MKLFSLFIGCMIIVLPTFAQKLPLINALSLRNGAQIIALSNSQTDASIDEALIKEGSAEALLDEDLAKGWASTQGKPTQCRFVFELSETFLLKKIGFNNQQVSQKHRNQSIKKIRIEFSNTSAYKGFDVEYTLILEANSPVRLMGIQNVRARWIRITILSNYGHKEYTKFNEIQAWGVYAKRQPNIDITGVWKTPKGLISFRQEGNKVTGCYEQNQGRIVNGIVHGRYLTFNWGEKVTKQFGKAILVVNQEQDQLVGIWDKGKQFDEFGSWIFTKKSNEPSECPELQAEGQAEIKKR